MSKLIKTNNALLFLAGVLCAGLSWLSISGIEHLSPGGASPFLHKLSIVLAVLCALAALICLILATQDSWQQLLQADSAQQPARPASTKPLPLLLASLAERYRLRKGVQLSELQWYAVLAPQGAEFDKLLVDAKISPLAVEVGTQNNRLPEGCAWWGSSLDQSTPHPTTLMLAVDLDEYGRYAPTAPAKAPSPDIDQAAQQLENDWHTTLRWLRPRSQFRGVIIAVSVEQLIREAEQDTGLSARLRGLAESVVRELGLQLPVFLVINHCGQLAGFTEFFLEQERSSEVTVGFELDGTEPTGQQLERQLEAWLLQLTERAGERASMVTGLQACRTTLRFPAELMRLRRPLEQLLQGLCASSSNDTRSFLNRRERLWLRALYFTGGRGGNALLPELPERLRPHIELLPTDQGAAVSRTPWLQFLQDIRQQVTTARHGSAADLTPRAWLHGLGARLSVAAVAGLAFTVLCGFTYGVKRVRGQRLLEALQTMDKTPRAQRNQALAVLPSHTTLLLAMDPAEWDFLPQKERRRLSELGIRDFRERYLEIARAEIPRFASSRRNELLCDDRHDVVTWQWELLRYSFLDSQSGESAQALRRAFERYKTQAELTPFLSTLDKILRDERDQISKNQSLRKTSLAPDAELDVKLAVADLKEPVLEMPRRFGFEGSQLFLKRAQGDCLQVELYESLHAQAWSRWLRLYAQQRIFVAAQGGTTLRSPGSYQHWLTQLRPQLAPPERAIGLPADATPHRQSSAPACQPLSPLLARQSLKNVRLVLEDLRVELPKAIRTLLSTIQPAAQVTHLSPQEQRLVDRTTAPFRLLTDLSTGQDAAMNKYLAALDKLSQALEAIENNGLPASPLLGLADAAKDPSWPRAAYDLLFKTRGGKGSELNGLFDARMALIKSLSERKQGPSADPQAGIRALQDILLNAESLVWEVLSSLTAEYIRVRVRGYQTMVERARANATKENLKDVSTFFEQFVFTELGMALPQEGEFTDYQKLSHRLVVHVDELKPFADRAGELLSQQQLALSAPPLSPAPAPAPPPPPAAPPPAPTAASPPASSLIPDRVSVTNADGCAPVHAISGVELMLEGSQFHCPLERECTLRDKVSVPDAIDLQTERAQAPGQLPLRLRTARWVDEHACEPGDRERDRCFRVSFGEVRDQVRALCQPIVTVYMKQPLRPRATPAPTKTAAPAEAPTPVRLEIPSWNRTLGSRCWLQWEAPDK